MITDLPPRILDAMRARNLKEKTIREFERYGPRRILAYCLKKKLVVYSKEEVWAFVLQERARMETGQLPAYQWQKTRRAAVYFEQMAELGCIQDAPLRSWEADHNRLFHPGPLEKEPSQDMETLIHQVRDAIKALEMSEKAKQNYIYCGLGPVLKYFDCRGERVYNRVLLDAFVTDAQERYVTGQLKRTAWQNLRKAALWIAEFQETGKISHRKLTNASFIYTSLDFEKLIREYDDYVRSIGYLKETTCSVYVASIRGFFRRMEALGRYSYAELVPRNITECLSKTSRETPLGIFNTKVAMRSFAQFIAEVHPELPDLTPALVCTPAKRRRVYEGYSELEAQKILNAINRESVRGKRDFAMVMLSYNTGLRGCDIVSLKFSNIDWTSSEIRLIQEKTNIPLALPLDTATGNAIAEYILNGRPECNSEYIFVRMQHPYTKLRSMWSMVAGYAHTALGKTRKMNGPHAFRRGMGRRLLEAGVPSPMICDVLGHASAHSLRQYTASSLEYLKQCARTMVSIPVMQEELL